MRWTINKDMRFLGGLGASLRNVRSGGMILGFAAMLSLAACKRSGSKEDFAPIDFTPYTIADSARITTYPNGLKLYVVKQGPGDYPDKGGRVLLHYQGRLADGTVFDDSYSRGEPLEFSIGGGKVIAGIEDAAKRLRFGTRAIAIIPPDLGYGDGKSSNGLPPKIPANATLTFHLDMVGSF
jgi:FKBP-type peptidyl-prolyl cis-trans isomerase